MAENTPQQDSADKPQQVTERKIRKYRDQLELPERHKLRAAAIKYDVKKDKAPRIIASGKAHVAEEILKLAEEHEIPFYEDKTLSDILSKLSFDQEIPAEVYNIVAEVLAFVYQLDKLAKKKRAIKNRYKDKKGMLKK